MAACSWSTSTRASSTGCSGLAKVQLHTASARSDAYIPGLGRRRPHGCGTASPLGARPGWRAGQIGMSETNTGSTGDDVDAVAAAFAWGAGDGLAADRRARARPRRRLGVVGRGPAGGLDTGGSP